MVSPTLVTAFRVIFLIVGIVTILLAVATFTLDISQLSPVTVAPSKPPPNKPKPPAVNASKSSRSGSKGAIFNAALMTSTGAFLIIHNWYPVAIFIVGALACGALNLGSRLSAEQYRFPLVSILIVDAILILGYLGLTYDSGKDICTYLFYEQKEADGVMGDCGAIKSNNPKMGDCGANKSNIIGKDNPKMEPKASSTISSSAISSSAISSDADSSVDEPKESPKRRPSAKSEKNKRRSSRKQETKSTKKIDELRRLLDDISASPVADEETTNEKSKSKQRRSSKSKSRSSKSRSSKKRHSKSKSRKRSVKS